MKTAATLIIIMLIFALFASQVAFAGCLSGCGSFSGNLVGNARIEFKPFSSAAAQQNTQQGLFSGGVKLNYNSNYQRMQWKNADLGTLGLTYNFAGSQVRFRNSDIMSGIKFSLPLKQMPTAKFIAQQDCDPCC